MSFRQSKSLRELISKSRTQTKSNSLEKYTFYPHAGIATRADLHLSNYTDQDTSGSYQDPFCGDRTYNGHRGIDTSILLWEHQDIGVPVFAALDGTVIATHDGEFDRNTSWNGQQANFVSIDHGNGHVTDYLHFKKNSVAVSVGNPVSAGQQIGLVGSSGISTGPHLHFATFLDGNFIDPFAGPCGESESLLLRQNEISSPMYIREFTITTQDLNSWNGPPTATSNQGKFLVNTTSQLYFWINLVNMTNGANYRIRYLRPNGSVAYDNGTHNFSSIYNWSWWWWRQTLTYNQTGIWKIEFSINGNVVARAPFEVVSSPSQMGNEPPKAQAVKFANPVVFDEVPVCRITNPTVLDDPDYDVVRFRYVWKVNGSVVRDTVSAALADALALNLFSAGDTILCEVTPNDGTVNGPMRSVSATVAISSPPEVTHTHPGRVLRRTSVHRGTAIDDFGVVRVSCTMKGLGTRSARLSETTWSCRLPIGKLKRKGKRRTVVTTYAYDEEGQRGVSRRSFRIK
ncbi:MAG: M23 family metallopeptidase [Verrucomicrobiales bacterium]|nr:M23 family metallopeptidase [Verrucomicrobiales bacterium]